MRHFPGLLAAVFAFTPFTVAQSPLSFELKQNCRFGCSSVEQAVQADFNDDGKPDLITANRVGNGQVFNLQLGNGDGTFRAPVAIGSNNEIGTNSLIAVDLNRDGILDLMVAGYDESAVYVLFGSGGGLFGPPTTSALPGHSTTRAVTGDFNGDGLPDIAIGVSNNDGNGNGIAILRNDGNKSFVLERTISLPSNEYPASLVAADVDHDGRADLAVADSENRLYILWGLGQNTFNDVLLNAYPTVGVASTAVTVGDLNQDASDDLLVSYDCNPTSPGIGKGSNVRCTGVDVYYGGQGKQNTFFRHAVTDAGVPSAVDLQPVDVNADGIADLVALSSGTASDEGLVVWLGSPDGSFSQTARQFLATSNGAEGIVSGDFNRDGRMDFFAVLNGTTALYTNATSVAPCQLSRISPTVNDCGLVDGTYVPTSQFSLTATANDATPITDLQLYFDGQLSRASQVTYQGNAAFLANIAVPVSPGTHLLVTKGWDARGTSFRTERRVTFYNGVPGPTCAPDIDRPRICLPDTVPVSSPTRILANGATSSLPTAAQLYIDDTLVVNDTTHSTVVDTTETLATGSHYLVFKLWDANGNVAATSKTITVQ